MFHFDANTFGNPTYNMNQTQDRQFKRGEANDVGRGLYREYNPTAPILVDVAYEWHGTTYSTFRAAWESTTGINHGANWFTVDLPLMLANGGVADLSINDVNVDVVHPVTGALTTIQSFQRYRVHARGPFNAQMTGFNRWNVTLSLDVDMAYELDF